MAFIYQQFPEIGYPIVLYYAVFVVGVFLILVRPFYAFLFSVMGLAAKNFHAAILTRTDLLGPYLNIADLLLWIGVFSVFAEAIRRRKKISSPRIMLAFMVMLSIASFQSIAEYGFEPFVMRSIWSVLIFMLAFLLAYNFVRTESNAKYFYWALFIGATLASLQHMVFLIAGGSYGLAGAAQLRTISYIMSGGSFFVIVALFSKNVEENRLLSKLFYPGLTLIMISFVMSQTRQLYIVFVLTVFAFAVVFSRYVRLHKIVLKVFFVSLSVFFISNLLSVEWSLADIIATRVNSLLGDDAISQSYFTRWLGMQTEIKLWLNSPMVFGVGTAYPPELTEPFRDGTASSATFFVDGALDHVAISSYLAHYGIVGVSLYLIFLPVYTMLRAKRLLSANTSSYLYKTALLAVAVSLGDIFNMFGSMLNTSPASHIPGLIYGALWGISSEKQ